MGPSAVLLRSTEELLAEFYQSRDPDLRTHLIERHASLVRSLAHKFVRTGVPLEDLVQCGWVALIHAVDRFNPAFGTRFTTYAVQYVVGEMKRYLRDKTWSVKVSRRLKELSSSLRGVEETLCQRYQRAPTTTEMAAALEISEEELLWVMEVGKTHQPMGLDDPRQGAEGNDSLTLSETVGVADERLGNLVERDALSAALRDLDSRSQQILQLRYVQGYTQLEVGEVLGFSQMHVSRLERVALKKLRTAFSNT